MLVYLGDKEGRAKNLALVLCLFIGLVIAGCSQSYTDVEYVEQAKGLKEDNNNSGAIIALKNALQQNPKNIEARWLLGETYLEIGDSASAQKELTRAVELGLKPEVVTLPLAKSLLLQREYQSALDVLKQYSGASSVDLLLHKAEAFSGLGKSEQAEKLLLEARIIDSSTSDIPIALAKLALSEGDYSRVKALIEPVLDAEPENLQALKINAIWAFQQQDFESAAQYYSQVIALNSTDYNARLGLAETNLELDNNEAAFREAEVVINAMPNNWRAQFIRAKVFFINGDLGAAEEGLNEVLRLVPGHAGSQLLMGSVQFQKQNYRAAKEYLAKYHLHSPLNIPSNKLYVTTLLELSEWEHALSVLKKLQNIIPDDPQVLSLLGSAYIGMGETELGREYKEQASTIGPDEEGVGVSLAIEKMKQGQIREAISLLEGLLEKNPDLELGKELLFKAYLQVEDFDKATSVVHGTAEDIGSDSHAQVLLGVISQRQDEIDKAVNHYTKALELAPESTTASLRLAGIALKQSEYGLARQHFENILEYDDRNVEAHLGLAALAKITQGTAEYIKRVEIAWEKNYGAVTPGLFLVEHYLVEKNLLKALSIARGIEEKHPEDPISKRTLGLVYTASGETENAIYEYEKLVALTPESPEAYYLLAQVQLKGGDTDSADANLKKALELDSGYSPAFGVLGGAYLARKNYEQAISLARDFQKNNPGQAAGFQIEGDVYSFQAQHAAAAKLYMTAFTKQPTQKRAVLASRAYAQAGMLQEALIPPQAFLKDNPQSVSLHMVLGSLLQEMGRNEEAETHYLKVISAQPNNFFALNNLSGVYHALGNKVLSLEYAEKAFEKGNQRPQVQDTLGWALVQNDQIERGIELLRLAVKGYPSPSVKYHLAVALHKFGSQEEAKELLEGVLKEGAAFTEREEAELLFNRLAK